MIHKVTLHGQEREVKFTTRALCRLEEQLGYSVLSPQFLQDRTISRVVKMLWAGLLHEDKNLSLDDVFDLCDSVGADILAMLQPLTTAFNYYWGIESEQPTEEKKTGD